MPVDVWKNWGMLFPRYRESYKALAGRNGAFAPPVDALLSDTGLTGLDVRYRVGGQCTATVWFRGFTAAGEPAKRRTSVEFAEPGVDGLARQIHMWWWFATVEGVLSEPKLSQR